MPIKNNAITRLTWIEVLNVMPRLKKAITLLLYRVYIKVLKDALAC
jgi:hypothetical protein